MINFFRIPNQSPLIFKNGVNIVEDRSKLQQLAEFIKSLSNNESFDVKDDYYGFSWSTKKYHNFNYFVFKNGEQLEFNDDVVARKERGKLVEFNFYSGVDERFENALIDTDEIDQKLFIPRALPWIFDFNNIEFEVGQLSSLSRTGLYQQERIEYIINKICYIKGECEAKQYLRSLFEKLGMVDTIIENDYTQCPASCEINYKELESILEEQGYGISPNFQIITCNLEWKYSVR